ncbi:MAG: TolC family protein [Bacteroidales bacterium]|nr:TolC family protein [Bacteroidales bacterium]
MCSFKIKRLFPLLLAISLGAELGAQEMNLDNVIDIARSRSVPALAAKSEFVSSYWAWRAYQASRLPSLYMYGTLGGFDRSLRLLQSAETGNLIYKPNYNMENSIGLQAVQNITATGGTLYLYSQLTRIDQFGDNARASWYAQPLNLSYKQPLFAYNRFKWEKRISPKEYEKAKRNYIESLEDINLKAVDLYFNLMLASRNLSVAESNFLNTSKMLDIAARRLSLGTVTRDDYLQLELRMLNDSISINENRVELSKARMELNSLLGLDESYEIVPVLDEELPDIIIDYNQVLEKSGSNSSFELGGEINMLNAEAAVEQAKADRGITMQLNATFGLTNTSDDLPAVYKNLLDQEVLGLTFSFPIFDWGQGRGKVKKAEAAADVIRATVEQERNDRRITLYTAVGQFNNQRQMCSVSRRAEAIARERYELVMEKFRNGNATVTDLNTARSESDEAIRKYVNDLNNYWTYYYTLRRYTLYDFVNGRDLDVSFEEMTE